MSISNAVGKGGRNNNEDVKVVQAALNLVRSGSFGLKSRIEVSGKAGNDTIAAIELFQAGVVGMKTPDGLISPNGKTIQALKSSIKKGLNSDSLAAIMAYGNRATLQLYLPLFGSQLPKYQIVTSLRIAHFLAQLGHESLSLRHAEELASGEAYEGRKDLGNTKPGDGKRFKGRGFIQLTGRNNYEEYSNDACLNLMQNGNESLIAKYPHALDVSLWFWKKRNLNQRSDMDDLRGITRRVNGGFNGLLDREKYLKRAKFFLI